MASQYTKPLEDEIKLYDLYRNALAIQMLTPAPHKAAIDWKRKHAELKCLPVERAAIEKAIADDEQWLKDHPVR